MFRKDFILILLVAIIALFFSACYSKYQLRRVDDNKNGIDISGSTASPERLIAAEGRNAIDHATAEAIVLDANGQKAIDLAVAEAIQEAKATFKSTPANVQAVADIIRARAMEKLAERGYGISPYLAGPILNPVIQSQLNANYWRQRAHEIHYNPATNPWLQR